MTPFDIHCPQCGRRRNISNQAMVGRKVECLACQTVYQVEPPALSGDGDSRSCPSCRSRLTPQAVLCVQCGLELETGRVRKSITTAVFPDRNDRYEEWDQLRTVARYQRFLIYAILVNFVLNLVAAPALAAGMLGNLGSMLPAVAIGLFVLSLATVGFTIFAIIGLASELHGAAIAAVYAILMFVPCVSLGALLVLNSTATDFLESRGLKVGLLGVRRDAI